MIIFGLILIVLGLVVLVKSNTIGKTLENTQSDAVEKYNFRQKNLENKSALEKISAFFLYPVWPTSLGTGNNSALVAGAGLLLVIMGLFTILGGLKVI